MQKITTIGLDIAKSVKARGKLGHWAGVKGATRVIWPGVAVGCLQGYQVCLI